MDRRSKDINRDHHRRARNSSRLTGANVTSQTSHHQDRQQKYLDDFRSTHDTKALLSEGYEIDYDRLVGIGDSSAVFLSHSINTPAPVYDKNIPRPLYIPGYDMAVKVVAKKYISSRRPLKNRTGNLQLALALGQTKPENNILKVIDIFKTPERIFVFMQYCVYGNVISFIRRNGRIPIHLAQRWSSQMAGALCFLHNFHIAHRNYKLENVLVDENLDAKLTGFGLSKFCIDLQTKQTVLSRTICGSEPYLAPEMLKESAFRSYEPRLADVWAFGVGVFLIITKRYPFDGDNLRRLKASQLEGKYLERDHRHRIGSTVKELLKMIFVVNPNCRSSMLEICQQSKWLQAGPLSAQQDTDSRSTVSSDRHNRRTGHQQQTQHGARDKAQPNQPTGSLNRQPRLNPVMPVSFQPNDALPLAAREGRENPEQTLID